MDILVTCPSCGREIGADAAMAGLALRCPGCRRLVRLPGESDSAPAPASAGVQPREPRAVSARRAGWLATVLVFVAGSATPMIVPEGEHRTILLFAIPWLVLQSLFVWTNRFTLRLYLGWVALSAAYLCFIFAVVLLGGSWLAAYVWTVIVVAGSFGFLVCAQLRLDQGRVFEATRARQAAWAYAALLPAGLLYGAMSLLSR